MIKLTVAGLVAVVTISGVSIARAKSIKAEMSSSQIADYCNNIGVNKNTNATFVNILVWRLVPT
jgi:hypothetical protein